MERLWFYHACFQNDFFKDEGPRLPQCFGDPILLMDEKGTDFTSDRNNIIAT